MLFLVLTLAMPAGAQSDAFPRVIASLLGELRPAAGGTELTLAVRLAGGYHVQANPASAPFLVPTMIRLAEQPKTDLTRVVYPEAVEKRFGFVKQPLRVYEGAFTIRGLIKGSVEELRGMLRYQACTDTVCLPPREEPFAVKRGM
ncbi:MAG: hypothetical protein HZA23_05655 [Nitrospirae bacterium]|nr:hypothetical protein [Nitrospirota bacterium]